MIIEHLSTKSRLLKFENITKQSNNSRVNVTTSYGGVHCYNVL